MVGLFAAQARAATVVYPAGGGAFSGSAEGWQVQGEPTCTIPLTGVCSATADYDGGVGNPAGSLAVNTNVLLNALGLLTSSADFVSADFVASQGGTGTVSLERAISNSGLLDLTPTVNYELTLLDRTTSTSTVALSDSASGTEVPFGATTGSVALVQGHTYALSLAVDTSSQILALGLLGGTAAHFDNVAITVAVPGDRGKGGGGDGKGNGSGAGGDGSGGSLTSSELHSLVQSSGLIGPATLKGTRLAVKARCPKKVGRACNIKLQGLLKKGKPATATRRAKVAAGKTKRFVLKVKPKARGKVKSKSRLLFKQTVKAGQAKATAFKRLKLVRR